MADKRKTVPGMEGTKKDWTWHIVLNRPHVHCDYSEDEPSYVSDVIPMYKSDNKRAPNARITVGWRISVYRFQPDMFDDVKSQESYQKGVLSLEYAMGLQEKYGFQFDSNTTHANLEEAISSPYGAYSILRLTDHLLVDAVDVRNLPKLAHDHIAKALEVLSNKKFKGVTKGRGDDDDFNQRLDGMEEKNWILAVEERPKNIVLHVLPSLEDISDADMDEFTKQIHLTFPSAKVDTNRILKDDAAKPENRLLWACTLASQMLLRYFIRVEKTEDQGFMSGNLGFGIDEFFRFGTPLKDVPEKPPKLKGAFKYASQLLASRPWSIFAPFEILKVTLTKDDEETTRWVMFTGNTGGFGSDGSDKSDSPFGYIQIQEDLLELTDFFGHMEMNLRSGMFETHEYPDRLYISSDPIGNVHYDTIYLLENYFGNSISPKSSWMDPWAGKSGETIIDFGIVPNMEVQTGRPDRYLTEDLMGRPIGRRPLTDDEIDLIPRICYYCWKFAKEHEVLGMKPSNGSFERIYPDGFSRTGEDFVKVEYNMDEKFGGIWNSQRKYMWFD